MSDSESGHPRDRIFLRDYVRELEIGAFAEEHGVTQRLRFDITLEVVPGDLPVEDDYTRLISYDDLRDAIETLARGPRMNLVETFAEHLAERTLADPRARRVHIRIAKLDRLPGEAAFGVEIVRDRQTPG